MVKNIIFIIVFLIFVLFTFWLYGPSHLHDPGVETGEFAPEFSAIDINNNEIHLADLKGRYILLDFWGTWCGPCQEHIPALLSMNEEYDKSEFMIIGISSDTEKSEFIIFLKEHKIDWIQILDDLENDSIRIYGYAGQSGEAGLSASR